MLRIWGRRNSSNVQKVMWTIGELAIQHQHVDAGGAFGGLDTAEFRRLNPNGLVPVIEDAGTIVWESNAIVRYLAAQYGSDVLWSACPAERARADQWMDWCATTLQPNVVGLFWAYWRTPEDKRNFEQIKQFEARAGQNFRLLDHELSERHFLAGNAFSIADIAVGVHLFRYFTIDIGRPNIPNVEKWYSRLKTRRTFREHVMISFDDLKGRLAF
jgi:glutathione S-transferase